MCGRYTLVTHQEQLAEEFEILDVEAMLQRFNIAPTQMVPVVRVAADTHARRLDMLRWGLIPHWAKDPSIGSRMINARSEGAAEKPAFRVPLRRRRCLLPSTGFYEWKPPPPGSARGSKKQPYYIRRADERVFAFAGLWDQWRDADGSAVESCTILTTAPNDLIRSLHDRMPLIVPREHYSLWLDPEVQEVEALTPVMRPFESAELVLYAVGTRVNKPTVDDPACIQPEPPPVPG